jgi:regulator of replication initiation timing
MTRLPTPSIIRVHSRRPVSNRLCCALLLVAASDAFLLPSSRHPHHRLFGATRRGSALSEAEKLEQQVRAIREELAALEGKSVESVEEEAAAKAEEQKARQARVEDEKAAAAEARKTAAVASSDGRHLTLPETGEDMVAMAAGAVERGLRDGVTRQTVRFALVPLDAQTASEDDAFEGWPGGPQQMYAVASKPLTMELLARVRTTDEVAPGRTGQPKVAAQDVLAFDGSGLVTAEAAEAAGGARGDAQALVGANTDAKYTSDIEEIDAAMGPERLFLLVNPFWRGIESWGVNILQPNARRRAQEVVFDRCGFGRPEANTFALLRFSVRGERCAALRCYPYPWQVFAYLEDAAYPDLERPVRLGTLPADGEPTSEAVAALINAEPDFKLAKTQRRMNRR